MTVTTLVSTSLHCLSIFNKTLSVELLNLKAFGQHLASATEVGKNKKQRWSPFVLLSAPKPFHSCFGLVWQGWALAAFFFEKLADLLLSCFWGLESAFSDNIDGSKKKEQASLFGFYVKRVCKVLFYSFRQLAFVQKVYRSAKKKRSQLSFRM